MKPIISVLMIILFANFTTAQTPEDFSELWKKVSDFESEGLPKSALEIVKSIEKKAKASNNTPQEIKTLLYRSKYALTLEEDAQLSILNEFKTAISKSETPTKNVLQNILATLYWQYFNQNRWKFYNRTKTAEKVDKTDFRTWDLETLFETIQTHYQASLENGLLLQQTSLDAYDALLIEQTDSKIYRPTLFDLLAHNALQFYKTDENTITKPAYKFEIDTPKLLNSAANFATMRLTSKDSTSLQLQALKLYQDLIKFHLKDTSPEALVDVDIERLKFVNQNAIFDDKEELLVKALKAESMQYKAAKEAVSGIYDFEIAQIYQNQGQGYQPKTNETNRWKSKEALAICDAVIADYPKHKAAEKCRILKEQILAQTLQIVVESNNSIQTNGLLLISYKNVAEINFKIAKVNNYQISTLRAYRENRSEELKMLENLKAIHHWTSTLKNEGDYQKHSTEIALPKLDNGRYVIYGSVNNESNTYVFKEFQVTNIAYIQKENNEHITYQIINRLTGQPIANAQVKFSYIKNYQGDYKSETYKTDTYGEFTISRVKYNRTQVKLEITANNATAYFENINVNRYYNYNSDSDTKTRYSGFLFSDRSIYRPGQTLYFKGIILKKKAHKTEIVTNETVEAKLYNTNNEEVAKLELKTNDYGSVSGEFILPDSGLTGNHYLRITGSNNLNIYHGVSVEEYKRPKFEAEFNPVTKTYKVHDTLTVKGEAIAYAGSAITDAKVVYRVHRKVQYPGWYYWRRPYFNSEPQEITHGETLTDASGHFEINFKAIPDESVDKSTLPTFSYEVTADITDINGETRSATTIVNVGYHALTASIGVANRIDKTAKNHQISIDTRNLNGEFVPAKGTIKIYKLIAPNEVLRPRPWNAPDYQEFSKTEFKSLFPHEAYDNEHDSRNWDQGELVFSETFDTEQSKTLDLGKLKRWASGSYRILLETKDRFGQTVKDEAQTHLYSDADTTLADHTLFSITTNALEYKTNETAQVTLGTSAKDLFVTLAIEKDHNIVSKQIINLSNSKKTIQIPVTESDLGGFVVHYTYAFQNSFSSGRLAISVPYPKTDLEIETMTFRDKLQPGTDETWRFKIKGPKGEQVAAELLASMYDASLDQFKSHSWNFHPIQLPIYYSNYRLNSGQSFKTQNLTIRNLTYGRTPYAVQGYDQLNFFGLNFGYGRNYLFKSRAVGISIENDSSELQRLSAADSTPNPDMLNVISLDETEEKALVYYNQTEQSGGMIVAEKTNKENEDFGAVKIRKNLQETAFFFPQLQTDSEGYVSFNFTTPEALTKWKLQLLAHTKTLESATTTLETVTQKELMVIPNAPRFLREGDQITISTKIANLTEKKLSGQAKLILTDAISGDDITEHLGILPTGETALFSVDPKGNTQASWTLTIPFDVNAVQYKILAKAGDFSDGEQNALPVLSNRMLVTETLPMWIRSNESKTFTLDKLKNVSSSTLKHHQLTLEMTSNPAWYAVQALPYLMEYPYDCNEQTFSRYYANALASHIATSNPRIQEVFNQWKTTDALLSNLEKNQELKSILIQETPWLRDAQSETEQKKRIALLFDLNKMNNELQSAKRKLKNGQMANGAWPWFNGGRPNRYITQHIITGFGHLDKLNVIESDSEESMIKKAIAYLDAEFIEEYNNIKKYNPDADLSKDHLSYTQLHYLYMRSFFPQIKASKEVEEITKYYHTQIQKYWLSRSLYAKGLMTLVVDRMDDKTTAAKILKSLRETSITSEELGMYWKENTNSWYWYQAPIETHALMIEVFTEAGDVIQSEAKNLEDIDNLKIWLLKNKQTNRWSTTKATTDAVYALLLQGSDWLSVTEMVAVVLGGKNIDPSTLEDVKVEAGTGYYKTSWSSAEIKPEMATVKLTKKGDGIAWGALYWQYFEDLDKITSAETPLSLKKKLFKKVYTAKGEEMTEITSDTNLKVGDLVRVRIELRSDRAMEFVHMKDMRAAGLEPINVLSQYKWQDGLGYYESTKDASTNFFFDYLPKGIYVFEYDLRVNNAGHMSNGITTIQSMYAPEFSSHSEGVKVLVEN